MQRSNSHTSSDGYGCGTDSESDIPTESIDIVHGGALEPPLEISTTRLLNGRSPNLVERECHSLAAQIGRLAHVLTV